MTWFDHYLKGLPSTPVPNFAYFRDWVTYTGNAAPAYASRGASRSAPRGPGTSTARS